MLSERAGELLKMVTRIDYEPNYLNLTEEEINFIQTEIRAIDRSRICGDSLYNLDSVELESMVKGNEISDDAKRIALGLIEKITTKVGSKEFDFDIIID
ncbi:MAG: hypothetical protein M0Z70_13145 [Nitrospiraceae bacterium]|jgi:uncharacterized protein YydD (DUF2326 family)|nr:hypothetical protein [Nitrospiraceae bacterium]